MPAFSAPISSSVSPELIAVIEADRAHDRDVGVDEVDGIQPPAEPDLEHGHVDPALGEISASAASALNSKKVSVVVPRALLDALERG